MIKNSNWKIVKILEIIYIYKFSKIIINPFFFNYKIFEKNNFERYCFYNRHRRLFFFNTVHHQSLTRLIENQNVFNWILVIFIFFECQSLARIFINRIAKLINIVSINKIIVFVQSLLKILLHKIFSTDQRYDAVHERCVKVRSVDQTHVKPLCVNRFSRRNSTISPNSILWLHWPALNHRYGSFLYWTQQKHDIGFLSNDVASQTDLLKNRKSTMKNKPIFVDHVAIMFWTANSFFISWINKDLDQSRSKIHNPPANNETMIDSEWK